MLPNVRRVFDEKPEYLKSSFLEHIRGGLPHTCPFVTHEKPPRDGIEVIVQNFVIPRHVVGREGLAPCPICSPSAPKYVKGHLLWSSDSKALYAVGHCCGHNFFTDGSLGRALTRNSHAERRRHAEEFVEANWRLPSELVTYWVKLRPVARDLDKVLKAIRVGLRVSVCREIHRTLGDGGYLKVQRKVSALGLETSEGLQTVEDTFGTIPVQGASILRGGSRGPVSVEARLSNIIAALAHISWTTEDDAILWLCEQVDSDVLLVRDLLEESIEAIQQLKADVSALHLFLEADNLALVNAWCLETSGPKAAVSLLNNEGYLTILRGGRRHRGFRLPSSLLNLPNDDPSLLVGKAAEEDEQNAIEDAYEGEPKWR